MANPRAIAALKTASIESSGHTISVRGVELKIISTSFAVLVAIGVAKCDILLLKKKTSHLEWAEQLLKSPKELEELTHGLDIHYRRKKLLPDEAEFLYKEDLLEGENAIGFYERVWLPYVKLGVLFQDDIRRLGEDKLIAAIRVFCHRHRLNAAEHLPPPRHARTDIALDEADPTSPAAAFYRERVRVRKASAKSHKLRTQMRRQP